MMKKDKYRQLNEMINQAIIELDRLIIENKHPAHNPRYDVLLKYLKSYEAKSANKDPFEIEIDNMGLKLSNYINGSIDPKEFYETILLIDDYFFNEFLLD